MKLSGKVLEVFVLDKEYQGLQVIDLKNWSGQAFIGYRNNLKNIRNHEGLKGPSIYFLLSSDQNEESGNFQVYIGETAEFSKRIRDHQAKKQWWDKFVCFTGKEASLTKAHVLYLEKKFHDDFNSDDIPVDVENDKNTPGAMLSKSDECYLEGFAENIYFILRTMGYDYLEANQAEIFESNVVTHSFRDYTILNGREFEIKIPKFGETAKMRVENGKCILQKGSFLCSIPKPSFSASCYEGLWRTLVESSQVKSSGKEGLHLLDSDFVTESPSGAGAMVWATRVNGPKHWKCVKTGKSFKELQKEIFEEAA